MRLVVLAAATAALAWGGAAAAAPALRHSGVPAACHGGVVQVALLSPAQLCPRPLATALVAHRRHPILHT